ncbi:MAG: response regulator transcription factor, partial [Terriglobia bacterium]
MKAVRILIADDHAIVRRGIRALLELQRGWKICGESATGKEAVAQAKRLMPDVAILD